MARYLTGFMSIAVILGAVGIASAANVVVEEFGLPNFTTEGQGIDGTNGWVSTNPLNGQIHLGNGPGGVNSVSSEQTDAVPPLHHILDGGPHTSGTLVATIYGNPGNSGYVNSMEFGFNDNNVTTVGGIAMRARMGIDPVGINAGSVTLALEPFATVAPAAISPNEWIQMRLTYNRDTNVVQLDYREVNDTTGLPTTAWVVSGAGGDRDDEGLAAFDATHFFFGSKAAASPIAYVNQDIPEPAGLALLAAGGLLLLRRRRRI